MAVFLCMPTLDSRVGVLSWFYLAGVALSVMPTSKNAANNNIRQKYEGVGFRDLL